MAWWYCMVKLTNLLNFLGMCLATAYTFVLSYVFFNAYFHNYRTVVLINEIGEADSEFILICFSLVAVSFTFISWLREQRGKKI